MLNKEAAWGGVWVKGLTIRILGFLPSSGTAPEKMLHLSMTQFPPLWSEILSLPFPVPWQSTKCYQRAKNCPWYHHHPCIPCPTNHCNMFPVALTTAAPAQGWAQAFWPICAVKNPVLKGLQPFWPAVHVKPRTPWMQLGARMEMQD